MAATDITDEFTLKMRQNAVYMAYFAYEDLEMGTYPLLTGEIFASKVRTGGDWDYKRLYGPTTNYIYNNLTVTGEDMWNMNYGFAGRGATFSSTLLLSAAGAYQIYSGTSYIGWWSTYFDDPNDQRWISYGISMFDNNSWPRSYSLNTEDINNSYENIFDTLTPEEKKAIKEEVLRYIAKLKKQMQKKGKC